MRLEPPGRLQQQRRRIAAPAGDERELGPRQVGARLLEVAQRPGFGHGQQVQRRRRTRPPGSWPGRRPAPARPAGPGRASASLACSRNAAAAVSPPRACARLAERSSSAATSSSGPGAACARCHARRSGSSCGSVASARARCACCLLLGGRRPGRPPSGPADGGTAAGCRTRPARPRPRVPPLRRRSRAGRPPATPAPGRRTGRPPRAAAACWVWRGRAPTRRWKFCSMLPASGAAPGKPEPAGQLLGRQPAGQFEQRQRVAPRLGDDLVPDPRRRSARCSAASQQHARVGLAQPRDHQVRQPRQVAARGPGSRRPGQPTPRPAGGRRTRESARRRGRATAGRRPGTPAAAPRRRWTAGSARPGRSETGPAPARRSGRTRSAARPAAGAGERVQAIQHRRAQLMQRGERQFHLRLRRRRPAPRGSPARGRPDSPAVPSCPRRPRRAAPGPGSRPSRTASTSRSSTSHSGSRPVSSAASRHTCQSPVLLDVHADGVGASRTRTGDWRVSSRRPG